MRLARQLQNPLQVCVVFGVDRQRDVHVRCAERILPVSWGICTEVMQNLATATASLNVPSGFRTLPFTMTSVGERALPR